MRFNFNHLTDTTIFDIMALTTLQSGRGPARLPFRRVASRAQLRHGDGVAFDPKALETDPLCRQALRQADDDAQENGQRDQG
jgi:hypothetical protein